jgi:hypothetical protein
MNPKAERLVALAAPAGALLGATGAIVYAFFNVLCSLVYAPLDVDPGEVGLGYADLLGRAAVVAIGVVIGLGAVAGTAVFGVSRLVETRSHLKLWAILALGILGIAALVGYGGLVGVATVVMVSLGTLYGYLITQRDIGRPDRLGIAARWLGIAVSIVVVLLLISAVAARIDIEDGRAPSKMVSILSPPWEAQIVRASWVDQSASRDRIALPACLLRLGENDGTTVLYDPKSKGRTFRLPTSALAIEAALDKDKC